MLVGTFQPFVWMLDSVDFSCYSIYTLDSWPYLKQIVDNISDSHAKGTERVGSLVYKINTLLQLVS